MQKKPGRSDSDRTLGNIDEKIHRRLKTIEATNQTESEDDVVNQESDLYEHIKDAKSQHDAQTFDAATAEQQKEQPVPNLKDDQAAEELTDQDVDMKPDDSKPTTVRYEIFNESIRVIWAIIVPCVKTFSSHQYLWKAL